MLTPVMDDYGLCIQNLQGDIGYHGCRNEGFLQDGDLYAKIANEDGGITCKLYPIGEKTFGRKGGLARIVFGENCLSINGITCKKL